MALLELAALLWIVGQILGIFFTIIIIPICIVYAVWETLRGR